MDKELCKLRMTALRQRLEIEQLVFRPDGKAAETIRAKYRRKRALRNISLTMN